MKATTTKVGLKIYIDGEHVKTVPSRYEEIIRGRHILNHQRKRLTNEERWILEIELLRFNLKKGEPRVFDLIKRSKPDFTQLINTKYGEYCELTFKNKISVRCSWDVHLLSISSRGPLFRNY